MGAGEIEQAAILRNLVRTGTVSAVDAGGKTARVAFMDKKNAEGEPLVSGDLPVLQTAAPWMPAIGQAVVCLYLPNGEGDGFVIGGY